MIKKYILSLLLPACCFCINLVTAQTWQWGVSGGSFESVQSDEKVETIKTDSNGNIYLLSPVGVNGLQVDGVPKEAFNNKDYMIASLSCSGNYRWSRVIGGGGSDVVNNMQLDADNNVYAAGLVYRTSATTQVHFGAEATGVYDTILPYSASNVNTNKQKLFLVKYNSDGQLQWLRMPEAADVAAADNSQTRTYDVQTDPQGNSYWLVSIPPGTYANGAFVNTTQGFNLFIFKYDTDGNFVSASTIDMQLQDYSPFFKMVRNHNTGTVYIGGYLDVGATPVINGAAITTPMYLAAFNGDGSFLWKVGNTGANGGISNLCLDNEGNVYVIGTTGNGDSFAGAQFTSAYVSGFPFIVKLTAGGQLLWATNAQTDNSNTAAGGIAINGNEVAITCGYGILHWGDTVLEQAPNEGYDVMLGRFNKADGSLIGLTDIEGNFGYWDYGTALTADPFGNYYVGGKFDSFLYVTDDDTLVDGAQGTDFFVAKYGTANCDCAPPTANFGAVPGTENALAFTFTYTGETYETIGWDFGDGGTSAEENPVHTYNTAGAYTVCVTVANACGTAEYCMAIEATLGVNSYQLAQVQTYPNPVKDVLSVTTDQDLTYSMYSVLGTRVAGGTVTAGTSQLQLEEFASGIYTLTLKNNLGEQKTIKVVKE